METNTQFRRNVCFSFFESYLKQGLLIKEQLGDKICSEYFIGLAEYALYKVTPADPQINMLITGLKDTIDAGQSKREKAFRGEDIELTRKILSYIEEYPEASEREIAKALECSNGKVNKVKQKYGISNKNNNFNPNLNSNNNTMSMSGSKNATPSLQRKRLLEDLSEEELESLLKKFKKRVKYQELYEEYNLASGCLNKDLELSVQRIKDERRKGNQAQAIYDSFENTSFEDIRFLAQHLNCEESAVLNNAVELGETLEIIKTFFQNCGDTFNIENYDENYKEDYSTFIEFVKMGIVANIHTHSSGNSATGF